MHVEHLIKMANQIGGYYEVFPDRPEALDGIATHIKKFWEPRMRREFLAHIDSAGTGELKPIVAETIAVHRARIS
jgi:formate dehydrogenase subunit delta